MFLTVRANLIEMKTYLPFLSLFVITGCPRNAGEQKYRAIGGQHCIEGKEYRRGNNSRSL
jgi:hypothetical protein